MSMGQYCPRATSDSKQTPGSKWKYSLLLNSPCYNISHSKLLKHCGIKWRGIYGSQMKTERVHAEKSMDWLSHSVSAVEIAINSLQT